jgi:hemoglobin-like flavoprotein
MTPEQTTLVQTNFAPVAPLAETAATQFYNRLFELNPSLRGLFGEDLREHRMELMAMLTTAVNNLHLWDAVAPHLKQLGRPHAGYGVKPADYNTIRTALIDTLEESPGEAFTPRVRDVWIARHTTIAPEMRAVGQTETVKT